MGYGAGHMEGTKDLDRKTPNEWALHAISNVARFYLPRKEGGEV